MLIHFFFWKKGTLTLSSVNTFDTYESLEKKIREKKWQHLYSYERCYQHWLQTAELSNITCAALQTETSDATQLGQITKNLPDINSKNLWNWLIILATVWNIVIIRFSLMFMKEMMGANGNLCLTTRWSFEIFFYVRHPWKPDCRTE